MTKVRRMRDFGVVTGMRMNMESTGGSQIANAANIHLAISTPEAYRHATIDFVPLHDTVTASSNHKLEVGKAIPSSDHGLGVTPLMEVLGEPVIIYG